MKMKCIALFISVISCVGLIREAKTDSAFKYWWGSDKCLMAEGWNPVSSKIRLESKEDGGSDNRTVIKWGGLRVIANCWALNCTEMKLTPNEAGHLWHGCFEGLGKKMKSKNVKELSSKEVDLLTKCLSRILRDNCKKWKKYVFP